MTIQRLVPVLVSVLALVASTAHADLTDQQPEPRTRERRPSIGATFTVGQINGMYDMYVNVHATRDVDVPAGLVLASNNPGEQKFVLDEGLSLRAGETASVRVFCMDYELIAASTGTAMRPIGNARPVVARIISEGRGDSPETRQRAIWTVRGSPENARDYEGTPIAAVAALLDRAGYRGRR